MEVSSCSATSTLMREVAASDGPAVVFAAQLHVAEAQGAVVLVVPESESLGAEPPESASLVGIALSAPGSAQSWRNSAQQVAQYHWPLAESLSRPVLLLHPCPSHT